MSSAKVRIWLCWSNLNWPSLDLALDSLRPILSLLFPFEVIADGGVALDADDRAPDGRAVVVFAFVNGCHDANLG